MISLFPGQGSQHIGMGRALFELYPREVQLAERLLGYDVRELCLSDRQGRLNKTEFTQPALFLVNALHDLKARAEGGPAPAMVAGHSLGEYNALLAAGVFDLETGLKLVARRGELMSRAEPGSGMAAVIGLDGDAVAARLARSGLDRLDIANINSPTQVVISGLLADIAAAQPVFEAAGARYVRLNVSAAFHSRYMRPAQEAFAGFLAEFRFSPPQVPVIANVTARPYGDREIADLLARQITGSVRWVESIRYMLAQGARDFQELGPKKVLTDLVRQITPLGPLPQEPVVAAEPLARPGAERLGSDGFKADHGVRHAYLAGAMHHGISSVDLVAALARQGFLASLGTRGLSLSEVEERLLALRSLPGEASPFAVNIVPGLMEPSDERDLLSLCERHRVTTLEVSAMARPGAALVAFRLKGLHERDGHPVVRHRLIVKLSDLDIAEAFLQPPSASVLAALVAAGDITPRQAELAARIPLADDVCLAAEGAWYGERGGGWLLFPALKDLRDRLYRRFGYRHLPRLGLSGGIGTPAMAASAFFLGADFIVCGSINQCTVEAGLSDAVKEMLATCEPPDLTFAPAGDVFEFGAELQYLQKGLLFPERARKLYRLYQTHGALEELDAETRRILENRYFEKPLEAVWQDVLTHWPQQAARAASSPRERLLLVFRWYFDRAAKAVTFDSGRQATDLAVTCSLAMPACNHWLAHTEFASWRNRRVADLSRYLLEETARLMKHNPSFL